MSPACPFCHPEPAEHCKECGTLYGEPCRCSLWPAPDRPAGLCGECGGSHGYHYPTCTQRSLRWVRG